MTSEWIPVTERMPEEHDSIYARLYGTDRWNKHMFRKASDKVIVTTLFEDGTRKTQVGHTIDGEWRYDTWVIPRKTIAWMPLPEPFQGVTAEKEKE